MAGFPSKVLGGWWDSLYANNFWGTFSSPEKYSAVTLICCFKRYWLFFFFCLISAKFTLRDSRDRVIANKSSVTLKNSILCVDVKTYFFKFSANLSCWRMKITLNLGYKVISQNSISNNKLKLAIIKQISKAHPEAQFLYLKIIYIIHTLSSKNNWTYSKN